MRLNGESLRLLDLLLLEYKGKIKRHRRFLALFEMGLPYSEAFENLYVDYCKKYSLKVLYYYV